MQICYFVMPLCILCVAYLYFLQISTMKLENNNHYSINRFNALYKMEEDEKYGDEGVVKAEDDLTNLTNKNLNISVSIVNEVKLHADRMLVQRTEER